MSETTPSSKFDHSSIKPATSREELISLLTRAFELEHRLACVSLFALSSLKNDTSEGGLTATQAETVRDWRRSLAAVAADRMLHMAQISNLLTALGAAPQVTRPTFPVSVDFAGAGLTLAPFSHIMIDQLVSYERLEAAIVKPEQISSTEMERTAHPDTSAEMQTGEDDSTGGQLVSFPTDYTTIGDLYAKIATSFRAMPAQELFIGPSEAQVHAGFLNLDHQPGIVIDQASALAAISMITEIREKGTPSAAGTHMGVCETIRTEYVAALTAAQQAGVPFAPVRSVGNNPTTHIREQTAESTRIVDTLTLATAHLFNDAYDTMLLMLQRFFMHTEESDTDLQQLSRTILLLLNMVIRPLSEALTRMPADSSTLPGTCAGPTYGDSGKGNIPELIHHVSAWSLFAERLWHLARAATALRVNPDLPTEIQEATAALQDLACQFAPAEGSTGIEAKLAELKQMQAALNCSIQAAVNGPYLVTNVDTLKNWLGVSIPTRPQMALCRCGSSATMPFCDGTHAYNGFTSQKDPKRVPNRRDTYIGTAITVLDNRGTCAHSGFCTDRLASAFHAGQEPFVSPNGARMDEIIRAVRSCPSGALSYALSGVEVRDGVDQMRPPAIEVSKDGPYRITGSILLKDGLGHDEARNDGASLEHYSLCRCGHSQNKPFCSGMHWYVNFHDPVPPPDHEPTLFEWVGGLPTLTRMTTLFYSKYIPQDPVLRPLFVEMAPDHPERVAAWLGEVFGGPKNYSQGYGGYSRMLSQHIGKGITEAHRSRWVNLLSQAADEAGLPADPEFRSAFASYIEWGSRLAMENSTTGARPPLHMPMPRWDWGVAGRPGSRISALAPRPEEEETIALPAASDPVHFTQHIKPLFRSMDRQSMKWMLDLWSYKDVKEHADAIFKRLQNGSMPCDGAWPQEKVETFQRWVASGMQE